jgi:replicative superfamily II helicase
VPRGAFVSFSIVSHSSVLLLTTICFGLILKSSGESTYQVFIYQVVSEGHSVLVFCSSRKGCETSARHIAKNLPPCTVFKKTTSGPKDGDAAVEELRRCSAGLDPVLAETLPAGVAYHHAGLTV